MPASGTPRAPLPSVQNIPHFCQELLPGGCIGTKVPGMKLRGTPLPPSSSTGCVSASYPAELGKARELPGSELPDGSHLPRAWSRKRASRTPPSFRSAPQVAPRREEPRAPSVLDKNHAVSPLRGRERRKAVSRGARSSSPPSVPIASPRGPAGPPRLLPSLPPVRDLGLGLGGGGGGWGGGRHPPLPGGRGRALPARAEARQPGAAARVGLSCAALGEQVSLLAAG